MAGLHDHVSGRRYLTGGAVTAPLPPASQDRRRESGEILRDFSSLTLPRRFSRKSERQNLGSSDTLKGRDADKRLRPDSQGRKPGVADW